MKISIIVNGKQQQLLQQTTLEQLITELALSEPFATAINQQFIAKNEYAQQILCDGDNIELVQPIVGG